MKLAQLGITGVLLTIPVPGVAAGSGDLLQQLEADHAALTAAERDFQQRRDSGELSRAAAADYASYLEGLRERVQADCLALSQTGSRPPADVPCAAFAGLSQTLLPTDQGVALSRGEQTSILDAELEAGLSAFDELLLREQERVRASAPRPQHAGAGAAAGSGEGSGEASGAGSLAGAQAPGASGTPASVAGQDDGATADGPRGAGRGAATADQRAAAGGRPADIPDGSDDDVVARQLREAAEKETDPELQKKLWDEYRRYKQGIR